MASRYRLLPLLASSRPSRLLSAILALAMLVCFPGTARAASPAENKPLPDKNIESKKVPTTPSAPPQLRPKGPADIYRCQRYFTYDGKVYGCDSNIGQDAERLRPILEPVPEAIAELDQYQGNRARIRTAAYVGTGGLLLMVLGNLISTRFYDSNNAPTDTSNIIRSAALLGGAGVMAGSFVFALSYGRENEKHLGRAVELYNAARPNKPIELQFSTQIHF